MLLTIITVMFFLPEIKGTFYAFSEKEKTYV